jgi:hypothetical protein
MKGELEERCKNMNFTKEDPENGEIKFLDIKLCDLKNLCWEYSPRQGKDILDFTSSHTRIIKNSIIQGMLLNSCKKSCQHKMKSVVGQQVERLRQAGYPERVISEQIRVLTLKILYGKKEKEKEEFSKRGCIPYYHGISHMLKNFARSYDMQVMFSFPFKLSRLTGSVNNKREVCSQAPSIHKNFTDCRTGCVYCIPLSCNKIYVGQTGKCINQRLTQHHTNLNKPSKDVYSSLVDHVKKCHCEVKLEKSVAIHKGIANQCEREIWEAYTIINRGSLAISQTSISLADSEMQILKEVDERRRRRASSGS